MLTVDHASEWISYDPLTGLFIWRKSRGPNAKIGRVSGTTDKDGYVNIMLFKRLYKAHRLAWFFTQGTWPLAEIDHCNGIRSDNRISNLRDVSRTTNAENIRSARSDNVCGVLGVSFDKRTQRFSAQIKVRGVKRHLGCFSSAAQASAAYLSAKKQLHAGSTL